MFHLHYWFLKVQYMGQLRYGQRERETMAYDWKELRENNISIKKTCSVISKINICNFEFYLVQLSSNNRPNFKFQIH